MNEKEPVSLSRFARFIESRRSPATRKTYRQGIIWLVGDPDRFLELAELDKRKAEDLLIDVVIKKRDLVKGASLVSCLVRVKSMLDFYEVHLNFKKVKQIAPKGSFVALDRAPLKEEIRKLLDRSPLRDRVVALLMASAGLRVGAFDYLDVGHFQVLDRGIGLLTVYAGEPEEYTALLSPEAVNALQQYLRERKEFAKEDLGPSSPLLRNVWDFADANMVKRKRERTAVARYSSQSIQTEIRRYWVRSGVRTNDHQGGKRKEFKACHGFRKFCKTQLSRAGLSWEDTEVLLGHKLNYYKPTLEHLLEVYQGALPFVTIAESEELKQTLEKEQARHESSWDRVRLENLELKDQMRETQEEADRKLADLQASIPAMVQKIIGDALKSRELAERA